MIYEFHTTVNGAAQPVVTIPETSMTPDDAIVFLDGILRGLALAHGMGAFVGGTVKNLTNGEQFHSDDIDHSADIASVGTCGAPGGTGVYCTRVAGHDGAHGDIHETW